MKTPLDQAIEAANTLQGGLNGISRLATACGVTRQFIQKMRRQWRDKGEPPKALLDYAARIETACGGAVKADALYANVTWHRDANGAITHYSVAVPSAEAA